MKTKLLIFIVFILYFRAVAQVPQAEKEALVSFYLATNGTNWTDHTNWNTTNPVSTWFGVSIIKIDGKDFVSSINLYNNNLVGSIPASLAELKELSLLNLPQNKLDGIVPDELKNKKKLRTINLYGNTITETKPKPKVNTTKTQDTPPPPPPQEKSDYSKTIPTSPKSQENTKTDKLTQAKNLIDALATTLRFAEKETVIKEKNAEILDGIVIIMQRYDDASFVIEGHTDSQNTAAFNQVISQERAEAVMGYLIYKGIDKNRLSAVGFGEDYPIDDNKTSIGRLRNRRVAFSLAKEKVNNTKREIKEDISSNNTEDKKEEALTHSKPKTQKTPQKNKAPTEQEKTTHADDTTHDKIQIEINSYANKIRFGNGDTEFLTGVPQRLDAIASIMKKHPNVNFIINAYSTNNDSFIAKERATAIKRYLVHRGIATNRLTARGSSPDKVSININK